MIKDYDFPVTALNLQYNLKKVLVATIKDYDFPH